jgi:hypothetical protein
MRMLAYLVEVDVGKRTRLFDERFSQVSVTSDEVLELSTVGSVGHFLCSMGGSLRKIGVMFQTTKQAGSIGLNSERVAIGRW